VKKRVAKRSIAKKVRRERLKHLDERLRHLNHRLMHIEKEIHLLEENRFYRVCIFGSARIKSDTPAYGQVVSLAEKLAGEGIDILTGGGPGLMEAANKGALAGREEKQSHSRSFGLSIELDFEPIPNSHLDVKRHHHKFSSRLDDFMRLSHSVIVTPGGIGTLLELYFAWQLIQVRHLSQRPIVLLDKSYWTGIVKWMRDVPLERGLIGAHDFDCLQIVDTPDEAVEIVLEDFEDFKQKRDEKILQEMKERRRRQTKRLKKREEEEESK
jgi:uncharacterized protein (TIGR00730 family)